ncbi:MAG: heavy-metal-associated domain-containing protein [Saprospiraceae bacterium]|nr:heavy-metal-associated domain-containing protein [Saprospiraceae bacterium]
MKNILVAITAILGLFFSFQPATAQSSKKKIQTEAFFVEGVCQMCEKRIEKTALESGVISAEWNKESKQLTIIYKPKKVALQEVKQAIAEAGHDTQDIKATAENYAKLPDCCAYRDGVTTH